jgi:hypothetical protein
MTEPLRFHSQPAAQAIDYARMVDSANAVSITMGELAALLIKYLDAIEVDLREIRGGLLVLAKIADVQKPAPPEA